MRRSAFDGRVTSATHEFLGEVRRTARSTPAGAGWLALSIAASLSVPAASSVRDALKRWKEL